MSAAETNAILNQVLVRHSRSLPMYLRDARPWEANGSPEIDEALRAIVADQQAKVDRIGSFILDNGGDVASGEFPMTFTALHDLSMEFCMQKMLQRQRQDVEFLQQASAALQLAPMARAVVDEALGAAKGHLQTLEELSGLREAP